MYHIVNISPEYDYDDRNGNYEIIQSFDSYDAADDRFDYWSERLPHAFLEIVSV